MSFLSPLGFAGFTTFTPTDKEIITFPSLPP